MVAVRVEVQENAQRLKARKALPGSRWFYLLTGQTKGRRLTAEAGSPNATSRGERESMRLQSNRNPLWQRYSIGRRRS